MENNDPPPHFPSFKVADSLRDSAADSTTTAFKAPPTLQTHENSSKYLPTTGDEPYASPKKALAKQEVVEAELKGFWKLETDLPPSSDNTLLETFFSKHGDLHRFGLQDRFGDVQRRSAVKTGRREDMTRGWKDWPSPPRPREPKLKEKKIVEAFVPFLNHIIHSLGLSDTRVAVDRQNFRLPCFDGYDLGPDVFLWGKRSPAFRHIDGIPSPLTNRKKKRKLDAPDAHNDLLELPPGVDWPWCVIPIEIKTEEKRGATAKKDAFVQLGTYVREVFAAQENRRFVPSLILTECTVEFLLWDRGGVVVSQRIDYHDEQQNNHILFCNMLADLVTWDDQQLGFDPTVRYYPMEPASRTDDIQQPIQELHIGVVEVVKCGNRMPITKEVDYAVEETLFRPYTLRGRGSTCWRVRKFKDGQPDASYLILDSWVKGGKKTEHDILRKIQDANAKYSNLGVAPLVHIGDVEIPGTMPYTDSVYHNRRGARFGLEHDLVHTRTVLLCDGVLLQYFADAEELLVTLHDVIQGHGEMYYHTGVVHRDIVPWNILIQRGAKPGARGILIDFSCATSADEVVPRPERTPGSHWFMCRKALYGQSADSHLDDLESFYWILCFIICVHGSPGPSRCELLPAMELLFTSKGQAAAIAKDDHFETVFHLPVSPFFGPPIAELVRNFHGFFRSRIIGEAGDDREAARLDYQEIVGYFSWAIKRLAQP